jgi:hypothetical protein
LVGKSLQDIQMSGTITVTKTFLPKLMPLEIKFDVPLSLLDPLLNSFASAAVMSFNYLSLSHAHSHSLALPEQRHSTHVCVCWVGEAAAAKWLAPAEVLHAVVPRTYLIPQILL